MATVDQIAEQIEVTVGDTLTVLKSEFVANDAGLSRYNVIKRSASQKALRSFQAASGLDVVRNVKGEVRK